MIYQTKEVVLGRGIVLNKLTYKRVILRERTVGDLLDCDPNNTDMRQGLELLCRQILRVEGDGEAIKVPLELPMLKHLTMKDLNLLADAAELLNGDAENDSAGRA